MSDLQSADTQKIHLLGNDIFFFISIFEIIRMMSESEDEFQRESN